MRRNKEEIPDQRTQQGGKQDREYIKEHCDDRNSDEQDKCGYFIPDKSGKQITNGRNAAN